LRRDVPPFLSAKSELKFEVSESCISLSFRTLGKAQQIPKRRGRRWWLEAIYSEELMSLGESCKVEMSEAS
jgi:hypothetical protein